MTETSTIPAAPTAVNRHRTKLQFAYDTLRGAIIRCELMPGERLIIDDLARRFEISSIPVREALRLLQSDGLVVSVAHVGATVTPISRSSIDEVFAVLEGLELVATRAAVDRATAADMHMLAGIVEEMDLALAAGLPEGWADLNTHFHLTICKLAGMPMLQEMMQRAFDHWDRLRRHYFEGVLARRAALAQAEHHALLLHLNAKDYSRVEQTIREHNRGARASYTTYLEADAGPRPDPAGGPA